MNEVTDLFIIHGFLSWLQLIISLVFIVAIPKIFGLSFLNGLLFSQVTLFFNTYAFIVGLQGGLIKSEYILHFYLVEFIFYFLTVFIYKKILERTIGFDSLIRSIRSNRNSWVLIFIVTVITFLNFIFTPTDGSSRIEYMTARWFSYIKPLITIALPLSYVSIFILILQNESRLKGYLLLVITVMASIFSGSKASFAFSLFTSFLFLKDLNLIGKTLKFAIWDKLIITIFTLLMVVFALTRLDLTFSQLGERFVLFGDATIMVYSSDDPTYPFKDVSLISKINRGWARLFGDESARDIDTLFGFALMKDWTGINTFTGPNARLSPYLFSNFQGSYVLIIIPFILLYFILIMLLFRKSVDSYKWVYFLLPFCISSINSASQDFNLIMQDMTIFLFFLVLLLMHHLAPKKIDYV